MSAAARDEPGPVIAVIGGTGALGGGLAWRYARAGYEVVIGSRTSDKAVGAAEAIAAGTGAAVTGHDNRAAAEAGTFVLVAVPFANQVDTLRQIAGAVRGKIVVDTTVPLVPPKVARVQLPQEGSAAAIAADVLGPDVRLVTAFHNVSAEKLRGTGEIACDVLVFGDDVAAREAAVETIARIGLRGVHGGPLANSAAAEALTSVLIVINRRYKVEGGAGIRIAGLEEAAGG